MECYLLQYTNKLFILTDMKSNWHTSLEKNNAIYWHAFITVVCISCFYNSLNNGLVHDDIFAIQNNHDIRPETSISNIFVNDFWGRKLTDSKSHKSYRPLCTLTFRLNYLIHKLRPFGYHLVNTLLHSVVTNLFLYILYDVIFNELRPSVFAALIFSAHPIHVEAVSAFYYFTRQLF